MLKIGEKYSGLFKSWNIISSILCVSIFSLSAFGKDTAISARHLQELQMAAESISPYIPVQIPSIQISQIDRDDLDKKYAHLDPSKLIERNKLLLALAYFDQNILLFPNREYLAIIDFDLSSKFSRFFIIHLQSGAVKAIRTAHGKNSDPDHDGMATLFSDIEGSLQSSVGVYRTAETYHGSYGLSMRLDGLSNTNASARQRAIVIHSADYVQEKEIIQGRSWGCPAVTPALRDEVIRTLQGGAMIYAGSNNSAHRTQRISSLDLASSATTNFQHSH